MALSGNKGEWSEIYALFKLLGEGKVFAGDENLNKITDVFYPIISILRREKRGRADADLEFNIFKKDIVVIFEDGNEIIRIPCSTFLQRSIEMLQIMKSKEGASFEIPDIEDFMMSINCKSLKAKSVDKSDIRIVLHDFRTGINPLLGFSIKSQVGRRSTLINPGPTTNIVYKVNGLNINDNVINTINTLNKGKKMDLIGRIRWIYDNNGYLIFDHFENPVLKNNLMMVDTILPDIIQRMLLLFYRTDARTVVELLQEIERENFMGFDLKEYPLFYRRKVANMLVDAALGMVPKTKWDGKYEATGGYLIVKEDGDVLCYHFYNRNLFENYLLNNTDFTTPGKHEKNNFGFIYKVNDTYYLNLELQVRFLQ